MRLPLLSRLLLAAGFAALPFDGPCLEPRDICPPAMLEEPSGIAYCPERGTLFAVGDEGDLVELTTDGKRLQAARLGQLDLEAVTIGPGGRLYLAVEEPPAILVVDPDGLEVERRIEIDPRLGGRPVLCLTRGGGVEGLCYVPELGSFFAVNQYLPARLVELSVPADGRKAFVKRIVADLDVPVACASDLAYDAPSRHFLVTSSSFLERPGKLFELSVDGTVVRERRLPGRSQEGFCVDAAGNAYVACDSGGVLRCEPFRKTVVR